MSKADKMFYYLGYEIDQKDETCITYTNEEVGSGYNRIYFCLDNKRYYCHWYHEPMEVTPKTHLAIHEKLIELGWLGTDAEAMLKGDGLID